jgi:hypothetical protein
MACFGRRWHQAANSCLRHLTPSEATSALSPLFLPTADIVGTVVSRFVPDAFILARPFAIWEKRRVRVDP